MQFLSCVVTQTPTQVRMLLFKTCLSLSVDLLLSPFTGFNDAFYVVRPVNVVNLRLPLIYIVTLNKSRGSIEGDFFDQTWNTLWHSWLTHKYHISRNPWSPRCNMSSFKACMSEFNIVAIQWRDNHSSGHSALEHLNLTNLTKCKRVQRLGKMLTG